MANLEQYANKYRHVRMERRDGILQITFHSDGGSLQWGAGPHRELPQAFRDIGSDPENRVIIMTGVGDVFTGPRGTAETRPKRTPNEWDSTYWEGKQLQMNLLDIEVPMISAINGPALRHSELPLLCDIVLAAEEVTFQDSGHFVNRQEPDRFGRVPGESDRLIKKPASRGLWRESLIEI